MKKLSFYETSKRINNGKLYTKALAGAMAALTVLSVSGCVTDNTSGIVYEDSNVVKNIKRVINNADKEDYEIQYVEYRTDEPYFTITEYIYNYEVTPKKYIGEYIYTIYEGEAKLAGIYDLLFENKSCTLK